MTQTHTLQYAASKGWGPSKTLSALGHPGYGAKFAREVLAKINAGQDIWEAIYGRKGVQSDATALYQLAVIVSDHALTWAEIDGN